MYLEERSQKKFPFFQDWLTTMLPGFAQEQNFLKPVKEFGSFESIGDVTFNLNKNNRPMIKVVDTGSKYRESFGYIELDELLIKNFEKVWSLLQIGKDVDPKEANNYHVQLRKGESAPRLVVCLFSLFVAWGDDWNHGKYGDKCIPGFQKAYYGRELTELSIPYVRSKKAGAKK